MEMANVINEQQIIRQQLRSKDVDLRQLTQLQYWRTPVAIALDLMLVTLAIWLVVAIDFLFWPIALMIIGNRQRALGNLIHEASHRNLHRRLEINAFWARAIISPLTWNDADLYRRRHLNHHMHLAQRGRDPDELLHRIVHPDWWGQYRSNLLSSRLWFDSIFNDLIDKQISSVARNYIIGFCSVLLLAIWSLTSGQTAAVTLALWIGARASTYHAITVFREMCDHYGLRPDSIRSYTRDIRPCGLMYRLIHPRFNGYHLTHHLLPTVPYYRLPFAQRMLSTVPFYVEHANVMDSYLLGRTPVIRIIDRSLVM